MRIFWEGICSLQKTRWAMKEVTATENHNLNARFVHYFASWTNRVNPLHYSVSKTWSCLKSDFRTSYHKHTFIVGLFIVQYSESQRKSVQLEQDSRCWVCQTMSSSGPSPEHLVIPNQDVFFKKLNSTLKKKKNTHIASELRKNLLKREGMWNWTAKGKFIRE